MSQNCDDYRRTSRPRKTPDVRAIQIVELIANGFNPISGKGIAENHILRGAEVRAGLLSLLPREGPPRNHMKFWPAFEVAMLIELWERHRNADYVAHRLGRSISSILWKLHSLGLISRRPYKRSKFDQS